MTKPKRSPITFRADDEALEIVSRLMGLGAGQTEIMLAGIKVLDAWLGDINDYPDVETYLNELKSYAA